MSPTAYEYVPSANGSVDRRAASSSQRRVLQQDAYRVFPRDPHALGVDTARLRGRPLRVLHTHVELDRAAAWTRMSVRLARGRQPRGRRRGGREWVKVGGWGPLRLIRCVPRAFRNGGASPDVSHRCGRRLQGCPPLECSVRSDELPVSMRMHFCRGPMRMTLSCSAYTCVCLKLLSRFRETILIDFDLHAGSS